MMTTKSPLPFPREREKRAYRLEQLFSLVSPPLSSPYRFNNPPKTNKLAMKSPSTTPQDHQFVHPKLLSCNTTTQNTAFNTTSPCYEPTSVLDLRRSSSPVSGMLSEDHPLHWNAPVLHPSPLLSSDDWDSMMSVLEGKDDSATSFKILPQLGSCEPQNPNLPHLPPFDPCVDSSSLIRPDFNPSVFFSNQNLIHNSNSFNPSNDFYQLQSGVEASLESDRSQLDQLIRAAECVESNELQLAQVILARLNQRLQSPVGKPLQRAAFYFKEALQSLLTGSNVTAPLSSSAIVHKIRAYKTLCEISPITLFATFTANQALLEALDGAMCIHVIDFEIGLGGQWASFMQELANRSKACNVPPSALRITAVIPEESSIEAKLIKDNLSQFAEQIGIRFHIEFLNIRTFEIAMFNAIRFTEYEKIAINLSPTILRHLNVSNSAAGFLGLLRWISPQIIVFVDADGGKDAGSPSFCENFINGLELYSSVLESLDATNARGVDLIEKIERYLLRPKIFASVAAARNRIPPWRELFAGAGMSPVPFSEFTDSQAECLVRRSQARGFRVAKRQASMLLYWQGKALVATSTWRY